ncbi:MAG TPA: ATP-binding protein [Blastocatellia bacterium]|nr:ATP-binding protein [Blastocatellia bacterium]
MASAAALFTAVCNAMAYDGTLGEEARLAEPGESEPPSRDPSRKVSHENHALLLALIAGLPAIIVALVLLWNRDYTPKVQWTLTVLILGFWWGFAFSLRDRVVRPLQTISNLLAALGEGDYSIRGRGASAGDALGAVMLEINALGETLRMQRLDALEATTLLRKVMSELEVAVFTFDNERQLALVNKAGERLLGRPAERLLGLTAADLGLVECLEGDSTRTLQLAFPGADGKWGMRRTSFREGGRPHQLLVLADLSHALREEERQAWQRLIRVLGHELNNSLAPIKSIAGSLENLITREPAPPDWRDDMRRGLAIISTRSDALSRFMSAYSRLARLPQPKPERVRVTPLVKRVASLETRLPVALTPGPDLTISADSDQLEQLLINLIRNAVDAAQETGGGVKVTWRRARGLFELTIEDDGPGLTGTSNLFVPFFTTKPEGSGIGLVLSRQIAEAHGGTLTLENRKDAPGCQAVLRLPFHRPPVSPSQSG